MKVLKSLTLLCVKLLLFAVVLTREDIFTAFGHGTGVNKAHINPLSVATNSLFHPTLGLHKSMKEYPKVTKSLEDGLLALAIPGEVYYDMKGKQTRIRIFVRARKIMKGEYKKVYNQYKAAAEKWFMEATNDRSLTKLNLRLSKAADNNLLIAGSVMCVLSPLVGLFTAIQGSYLMLFGLGMMYFGTSQVSPPVLTEMGMYLGGILVIGLIALEMMKPSEKKPTRKVKTN